MQNPKPTPSTTATADADAAGLPHPIVGDSPGAGAGVGAASGAAAGAAIGAFAGPPGMVVGAIIGAAAGAATGAALANDHDAEAHDAKLDEEIGVTGGDLGAAKPGGPTSVRGTFSGGSAGAGAGVGSTDDTPDAGPLPRGE